MQEVALTSHKTQGKIQGAHMFFAESLKVLSGQVVPQMLLIK